nr:hypothetical protein [Tanacetum cinerariifolium]
MIIMVVLVVLQATAEGAHFNAEGEHPKGCVRFKNACNLASCNWSCEDAVAVGWALFNAGGAHFNAGGKHPKRCVRLMNACNLASCNMSCEDAGGGICISKDYFRFSKMEMKKIIMVVLVVLQAAAEGAHFKAEGAHFNAEEEQSKGCVRLKNTCNLASCNMSCEDAGGGICISKDYPEIHPPSQETSDEVFQANHSIQNEESFENPSNEISASNPNQEKEEPPQDSNIHQLIEGCSTEVSEKQKMEDTMLELVKICQEKKFLCIHDDEVKNVVEQPAERGNRSIKSLQNFRVVHKNSISLNNTSQISSIHAVAPILSAKEPEHLLSMEYEHLSITPETESDEVTESNAENILPIPSECEVTSEDEIECDMPAKDVCSPVFTTFSNHLFKDNDDLDSSDNESLPDEDVAAEEFKIYSNPLFDEEEINSDKLDPHCFNVESDFVISLLNQELNAEIADTIVESIPSLPIPVQDSNSQREEIDIVTETNDVLPSSVEDDDDLSNDPILKEADLFLSDNSIPSDIENVVDDPEGDV